MSSTRLRSALGVAAGVVLAGAAVASVFVPWPQLAPEGTAAPSAEITPAPAEATLACDGPIVALGRDASDASGLSLAADMQVTSLNGDGDVPTSDQAIDLSGVGQGVEITQLPDGQTAIPVSGSASADLADDDLSGFVASACRSPQPESWLVGATIATGVTDIIEIANPTDVAATVTIDVYGVDGASTPAAGTLAIPAHSQVAIPAAGLAGTETSPVFRVTSEGAPVRASLQSSTVELLDARGADMQPGTLPDTSLVIPHIEVTDASASDENHPMQLRLLGTEGAAGAAHVSVVREGSGETVFESDVDLAADQPVTASLEGIDPGAYAVRVDASTPVVGALEQTIGTDYAWLTPTEDLGSGGLVSLPATPGANWALSFAASADGDARVTVEPVSGDGDAQTLDIDAGTSRSVSADPETTYRVTVESGSVAGSASYTEDDAVAAFPIEPDAAAPEALTIYP
ncbi:DUF5719 family protein [Microbacterium indicum]|uniref:DUF5719 family protein n=1 Tax=Microbacterium indicum TaxID=358100 RepID=UPI0004021E73|nr:DUF5719 family protein [Microbacterium indicum]